MNIFDSFQQFVTAVIQQLGASVQVPGMLVGGALLVVSAFLIRRSDTSTSMAIRIIAGLALTLGLPILLTSFGVGATDALLWSILALFASSIWLVAAKGKAVTIIGIVFAVLALSALVGIARSNPSGSIMADMLRTVADQVVIVWTAIT
jgi:hypothetical protein